PPNPTELLGNGRLKDLLEEVRSQYDYVLLDCPPIEVVADTEIISSYVDRTIFIVRAGLLDRSLLKELQRLYNAGKYRNMALILNGTETRVGYHRYGYGYGFGYGYGYGYGETDDDKKKHKSKKK
ncbi:MAG: chromosome partitioning protein ParA, partial [Prevotella sp.]|nr:chromosome partitioning protein ParA [Prevotella sp.]